MGEMKKTSCKEDLKIGDDVTQELRAIYETRRKKNWTTTQILDRLVAVSANLNGAGQQIHPRDVELLWLIFGELCSKSDDTPTEFQLTTISRLIERHQMRQQILQTLK